ncbi:MAG: peptide chain release factor N(5)-glutamine methyltransferase [Ottowia sp.]|nr:peptide chain release factor N(5)-glutamine methyltransferase [Ottowia sp.]
MLSTDQHLAYACAQGLSARDARLLLMYACDVTRSQLITYSAPLTSMQADTFQAYVTRRLEGEPIAYILGQREFFSLTFLVSPATLIPRHETEGLVERALLSVQAIHTPHILELGTGCGAIAITLAHHLPNATIVATDLSATALAIATENAQRLLPTAQHPLFYQGTWWDALPILKKDKALHADEDNARADITYKNKRALSAVDQITSLDSLNTATPSGQRPTPSHFHLIVSNPPYIAANDMHLMQGDLRFEPIAALTDHHDGLSALRQIIVGAPHYLCNNGQLLLEHGYDQAEAVYALLQEAGFCDLFCAHDWAGLPRISGGTWLK